MDIKDFETALIFYNRSTSALKLIITYFFKNFWCYLFILFCFVLLACFYMIGDLGIKQAYALVNMFHPVYSPDTLGSVSSFGKQMKWSCINFTRKHPFAELFLFAFVNVF